MKTTSIIHVPDREPIVVEQELIELTNFDDLPPLEANPLFTHVSEAVYNNGTYNYPRVNIRGRTVLIQHYWTGQVTSCYTSLSALYRLAQGSHDISPGSYLHGIDAIYNGGYAVISSRMSYYG